ncbi:hypothetical protein ACHAW5_000131 [Stephanodiscus triporus]|uniref:t-SNARE coiled-coil homology domain-containing protein n=1 Tax=Stephanodiscus triporus TaxID=2934178 RepID=A0ABD3MQG7_9STRA
MSSSSGSYSDYEREYDAHLSRVRSYLARPNTTTSSSSFSDDDVDVDVVAVECERELRDARRCAHAMVALAEVDGDPFRAEGARRGLERDVGTLEGEIAMMRGRRSGSGGGGGGRNGRNDGRGATTTTTTTTATMMTMMRGRGGGGGGGGDGAGRDALFGDRGSGGGAAGVRPSSSSSSSSYSPPSIIGNGDVESGSSTTTFAAGILDTRMEESERLLRETQALCAESEQIGNATLETMGRQREQIERSGGLIERSIENTRLARQIMKEM